MPTPNTSGIEGARQSRALRSRAGVAMTAVALCALAGGAWAVLSGAKAQPKTTVAAPGQAGASDTVAAARMDFDITTMASGVLEAKSQVELRNRLEFEAAITELVPEGSRVKKGDVLARLNADQLQQQIDQQEIELERAKNEVASAESELEIQKTDSTAEIRRATVALDLARLEFQQWLQGDVETKRQDLRVRLDEAHSEVERLRVKVTQNVELRRQGFISQDELQKQELDLRKQEAALETARLNQRVYEEFQFPKERKQKQEAIDAAEAELKKTQQRSDSQLANKESRATNCRKEVLLRQQRLDKLREQMTFATITAPQDGLVVYGSTVERRYWGGDDGPFQIGRKIYPNQLIIALPDTSAMNAKVAVHESIAGRVKPGQTATVKIDAIGGVSVSGTVEKIGLLAQADNWRDPNLREYSVTVNLGAEASRLDIRPSMRCDATLMLGRAENVLAVPVQAIFSEGPVRFVHVQHAAGELVERVPVLVGQKSDRFAEVTAGVTEGTRVLVRTPRPEEVRSEPFTEAQLSAVRLKRNGQGEIVQAIEATKVGGTPSATQPTAPSTSAPPGVQPGNADAAECAAAGPKEGDGAGPG